MEMLRDELFIHGDSQNYEVLQEACNLIKDVPGLTCEIGVRMGYGSKLIMETLSNLNSKRPHICIDPYGAIDYHDVGGIHKTDYTNDMKNACISLLHEYAYYNQYNLIFFTLEDTEFFERFKNGVPVYESTKTVYTNYALVHVDGPHNVIAVHNTALFFNNKMSPGGIIVFDDVDQYAHDFQIEPILFAEGFALVINNGRKKAYKKIWHLDSN